MKNVNKEKICNVIIVLIVILLYIAVSFAIYSNFRERKRKELSNDIIDVVDKQIEENKKVEENNESNNIPPKREVNTKVNGINYTVLGKITIDKIRIYQPIVKENTKGAYDVSAVKMSGPDLNTNGNVAIGGHNFMKGKFFIKIMDLVKDDVIKITDLSGKTVKYYVYEYSVIDKDNASYLAQPENENDKIVTLVTCTKGGKERYYVKAKAK